MEANYRKILKNIDAFTLNTGRMPGSVILLAVSKGQPVRAIQTLYDLGQRHFGENYAQELMDKYHALKDSCPDICWHYIGALQSKKIKEITQLARIDTVSKPKHVAKLAKLVVDPNFKDGFNALLQVKFEQGDERPGILLDALKRAMAEMLLYPAVRLRGLMVVLPLGCQDPQGYFTKVREKRDTLERTFDIQLPELSMGMSGDFEEAIKCGSTMVRIGTALFGPRPAVDKKQPSQ